jgi:alpha-galactosidase
VDYLKYDNCWNQGVAAQQRYKAMGDALKATGRPIVYSICEWGQSKPWLWAQEVANMWRTRSDIGDDWGKVINRAHLNQKYAAYAGPGAWNDPDMLQVGRGGQTDTEYRTQFSLWSMMASPLLISTNLSTASAATLAILKNTDVIAVDQDRLGRQGTVISSSGGLVVMSKPLSDGSRAVSLTNETTTTQTISTTAAAAGIGGAPSYTVKDLWSKDTVTSTGAISASVPPHGTVMYRVTPSAPTALPAGTHQLGNLAWTSASNGWGPVERNHSNGDQAAGDGKVLTIAGTPYTGGLGVHSPSEITYYLGGRCASLRVDVGIDDEEKFGSVIFRIYRDQTLVAESTTLTAKDRAQTLTADLTGGTTLRLVTTDAGDGASHDHADWAAPTLTCS